MFEKMKSFFSSGSCQMRYQRFKKRSMAVIRRKKQIKQRCQRTNEKRTVSFSDEVEFYFIHKHDPDIKHLLWWSEEDLPFFQSF